MRRRKKKKKKKKKNNNNKSESLPDEIREEQHSRQRIHFVELQCSCASSHVHGANNTQA